jgi:hypothetical protein
MEHFPPEMIAKKNDTELFLQLTNGSTWQLGGVDNPDSWRGTNPVDVVFDEYSEMKEDIWTQIIRPILTENHGTASFIFTLKGRNHAWKLSQYAKQNEGEWGYFLLNVNDTKAIPEEELAKTRKEMPEAFYRQEFLCEALDDAGQVFKRVEQNVWSGELQPVADKFYTVGIDLAKYQDWTVLTPIDLHSFKVGFQERFNQIDWPLQEAKIEAFLRRYNGAKGRLDSTGIGDPVYDHLSQKGLNIESFKFTEESRQFLLENLMILLEQDKIKIPDDPILKNELKSAQYQLGERGKVKIVVPEGLHDDCLMSLALAVWDLPSNPMPHETEKMVSEFNRGEVVSEISRFHYE